MAVGATDYRKTPAFGVSIPVLEPYSTAGPTPVLFDRDGHRLATADARASKPEIVAPDAADTSFFGPDTDADGFPNFFGDLRRRAARGGGRGADAPGGSQPHPGPDPEVLQNTALDMAAPGFDNDTGFGLIQAGAALAAAGAKVPTTTSLTSSANSCRGRTAGDSHGARECVGR